MEEVYTCICGFQTWIIYSDRIRCGKCERTLRADEVVTDDELISPQEFNAHIRAVESVKKGVELE